MCAQDRQARNEWNTLHPLIFLYPVKTFDQINILPEYSFQAYRRDVEPGLACQRHAHVFGTAHGIAIVRAPEFRDPRFVFVNGAGLRPGSAKGGTACQKAAMLWWEFVSIELLYCFKHFFEIQLLTICVALRPWPDSLRSGQVWPKSQRTNSSLTRSHQVIEFRERLSTRSAIDQMSAPAIGSGIANAIE